MTAKTQKPESATGANSEQGNDVTSFLEMELPPVSAQEHYHDDTLDTNNSDESKLQADSSRESPEDYRGLKDDKGNAYDPAIHSWPAEKTAGGKWRRIPKREREKKEENGEIPQSNSANRMEAQKMAQLYAGLHLLPFGHDGLPDSPTQLVPLTDALEQYFNENGAIEIPAGFNVLLTAGMYTQQIAAKPSNWQKCKTWFSKIPELFGKKKGAPKAADFEAIKKGAEKKEDKKPGVDFAQ